MNGQEQKKEPEQKKEQEPTVSQIQEQIKELQKTLEAQKSKPAEAVANQEKEAAKLQAEEAAKLQAEADIKKLLSEKDSSTDYDDLSNKEILDIVANAFDTAIEARTKLAASEVEKPLVEINKKIESIQKYLLHREAASGIDAARNKFKDFDDYKEDIAKIFEAYPGISPEDAYILAKGHKASDEPPESETASEKPISLGTRAAAAVERYEKIKKEKSSKIPMSPQRAFKSFLDEAADKVLKIRGRQGY